MRVVIVDDEDLARERIRVLLARAPDIEVISECADGVEAVEAIENLRPDLVFLDIQMPLLDGFGVVEQIGASRMPATLFVTAYDQHALHAFEAQALDYLLKPFEPERFQMALDRARRWCQGHDPTPACDRIMAAIRHVRPWLERLLVRQGDSQLLLRTHQIQWVEAEGNYVRLHVDGTSYLLRQTLGGLLPRLDPDRFRRVHRCAAVNMDFIQEIRSSVQGERQIVMRDGTRLTMSKSFREAFGEWALSRDGS